MGALGLLERNERDGGSKCVREREMDLGIRSGDAFSAICDHLDHYWSYCLFSAHCSLVHLTANLISLLCDG